MTVCIAAICKSLGSELPTILGASDRMLTAGDIEFEPQTPKIFAITNSIALMLAGDSSMQVEVISEIVPKVTSRIQTEPKNWWNVRDIADLYAHHYNLARLKRAENEILAPLGLNRESFLARQPGLDRELVHRLANDLRNYTAPAVEAIFAGIDLTGAHIFVAYNSDISCLDLIGFAAVGIGSRHANSEFMFAKHTRQRPLPETLLLVYSAKKRAEVAPGVGTGTDMFMIGPMLGTYDVIRPDVVEGVENIYQNTLKKTQRALLEGEKKVNGYIESITKPAQVPAQTASPEPLPPDSATGKPIYAPPPPDPSSKA